MEKRQALGILGILAVVAGLLVLPPFLQQYYGMDAVKITFGVIIVYAVINKALKSRGRGLFEN